MKKVGGGRTEKINFWELHSRTFFSFLKKMFSKISNWIDGDNLSVTTKAFKAIKELEDGNRSFFNQVLAASLGWKKNSKEDLSPVKFGNGEEIPDSKIQIISELAKSLTLLRQWEDRDILLIDNYRVMHGRKPFSGGKSREVLVSLTN